VRNQFIVFLLLVANYYGEVYFGRKMERELPSLFTAIWHFAFFVLTTEVAFYYSHRLLHHPYLYKWIHKKHHTWISPVAISAAYCHPIEHVFSNVLPIALGNN